MRLDDFLRFRSPAPSEIPRISLYMDQLTGWFDEVLKDFLLSVGDKTLTKTMVNNYVKARLIVAPEKKKYDSLQLKMLTMVYHLKNVLSIEDMKILFEVDKTGRSHLDANLWYERYSQVESELFQHLGTTLEGAENASAEERRQLALSLAAEANLKKRAAELLINSLNEAQKKPS